MTLKTSHMQEMKRRYASMYIPAETVDDQFNEHCGVCDEQGIDEAVLADRDYEYDGKVIKISKKNFSKVHRDFKNSTKGKETMITYDSREGTVLVPVEFTEEVVEGWKKGKYTIKDENGKILGTYSSGSKAKKVMDDLMQKGDYPELTVSMVEEVEITEATHDKKGTFTMAPFEDLRGVADVALKIMQGQPQEVKEEEQEVTSEETPQKLTE